MFNALCVVKLHTKRHASQRASAHPPDAQRQGLAHGGLPLLAARLVQRGLPLLGCRLYLGARLRARLVHLARGGTARSAEHGTLR